MKTYSKDYIDFVYRDGYEYCDGYEYSEPPKDRIIARYNLRFRCLMPVQWSKGYKNCLHVVTEKQTWVEGVNPMFPWCRLWRERDFVPNFWTEL